MFLGVENPWNGTKGPRGKIVSPSLSGRITLLCVRMARQKAKEV
jgi:hypothetical protein